MPDNYGRDPFEFDTSVQQKAKEDADTSEKGTGDSLQVPPWPMPIEALGKCFKEVSKMADQQAGEKKQERSLYLQLPENLMAMLEARAEQNDRTVELEARNIIRMALTEKACVGDAPPYLHWDYLRIAPGYWLTAGMVSGAVQEYFPKKGCCGAD